MPLPHSWGLAAWPLACNCVQLNSLCWQEKSPDKNTEHQKPWGPGWPLVLKWGSCSHHAFSLFLAWGFLVFVPVFVGLLLRQKRAGKGLSLCPTWADQLSCSGCVSKVISSPAVHSTWETLWCINTARVRQIHSAQTLSRRASQDTAERVRSRHAVRPLSAGSKESFYREAVMSHKAPVSRGGTESCLV